MTIESDIKSALDGYAGLSTLVGSRNYFIRLPQEPTYPNTVTNRVVSNPLNALDGRNEKQNARFRIDARGETYDSARDVAAQVIAAMEAASFTAVLIDDSDFPYEPEVKTYRVVLDFSVWF